MVDVDYKFLRFVEYSEFEIWAVKNYLGDKIISQYRIEPLGKHIIQQSKKVKLFEMPNEVFGILGISNETGMFDAYCEKGEKINQPYKIVENGYLAYNPYRVNVGSVGIKTENLNNSYISPAYVVFSCQKTLLPNFLFIIIKGDKFNTLIRDNTTGSVRQTLGFDVLSSIRIPIPPITVQQKLVDKYNNTIAKAIECEKKANELELEIDKLLFDELGIKKTENVSRKISEYTFLNFFEYDTLDNWSPSYLLNRKSCDFIKTGKYNAVQAKKFINSFQYGLSEKASEIKKGIPMLRMNNIVNTEVVLNSVKYLDVDESVYKKHILNKGDLLFNRTNSKELVGKTAIFNLDEKYTFASYLIRVVLNENIVNPVYINILFNSPIVRCQIDLISRQVLGQANINSVEMQTLRFPLPPIEIQNNIVRKIEVFKQEIGLLRTQAQSLRGKAKYDFEKEVF